MPKKIPMPPAAELNAMVERDGGNAVAAQLGCHVTTVYDRLRKAGYDGHTRRTSPRATPPAALLGTPATWLPADAEPACAGDWHVFDALVDMPKGRRTRGVREERVQAALDICGRCPITDLCWRENADEPWLKVIRRALRGRQRKAESGSAA